MTVIEKVKTGVEGLDQMLLGGFLPKRPYVVCGPPGSGKTTLGLHFLLEGLKNDESVMLIAVDEPPTEIKSNVRSFNWNLDQIKILDATPDISAYKKTPSIIDVGTVLDVKDMKDILEVRKSQQLRIREVSVHSIQKMLKQEFDAHLEFAKKKYSRIVIDSLTSLKLFGMKGEDWKKYIQSFFRFLSELETTTLVVADEPKPNELESEFLISRGEIRLYRWLDVLSNELKRAVSIEKLRGSSFDEFVRPLSITTSGLVVGEGSVKLKQSRTRRRKKQEPLQQLKSLGPSLGGRLKFGIKGLDAMLYGGLLPKRPYIISGPPGSGKTTLSMHFLLSGLDNLERGLFVALEEPPNEIKINMEKFHWDIGNIDIIDANADILKPEPTPILEISSDSIVHKMGDVPYEIRKSDELRPFEVTIHSILQRLKREFVKKKFQRVVIDSLTALEYFYTENFELHTGVYSFLRFLTEWNVTALLTVEVPESGKAGFENLLSRGEIKLHKYREGDRLKRGISIDKYRGSAHDEFVHPLEITDRGLTVL
jgi:KaiC/GvpD/RAD55 family RecA-like ATPase